MTPRAVGLLALLLAAAPGVAAVRDVAGLPGLAQWMSAVDSSPQERRPYERRVVELLADGDDAGVLAYVRGLAGQHAAIAAGLHEALAGAYVRDRRHYRAQQHLDSIGAARSTDQSRYLAAVIAARQQRLEAAADGFDALARRLPDDPVIARDQAQIASLLDRHEPAAAATARLLRLRPNDGWAALLEARMRMQQGRTEEAERLLEGLLAREPRNGEAALALGLLRLAGGELADARSLFLRSRTIGARSAVPYAAEAVAAALLGDAARARATIAGALKQNPADPLAGLVWVLVEGEAEAPWAPGSPGFMAASLYPDLELRPLPDPLAEELASAQAAAEVAAANLLLEQWSGTAALDALSREAPSSAAGPLRQLTAIRAAIASGDLKAAEDRLALLKRDPAGRGLVGPDVLSASLAARKGDAAGARAAMRRALERHPESPRLHALAGDLELAAGQAGRAVPEYREALAGWSDDPRLLNQLAAALALTGSREQWIEALTLVERGLARQPHYLLRAHLLDTRADLLYRLGRTPEALAAYRELSTTVGGMTTPEQWHRLAVLAAGAGDSRLARQAFEEALDYGRPYPGRELAVREVDGAGAPKAGAR